MELYIDVACYSLGIHFHTCMPELYLISQLMSLSIVIIQKMRISKKYTYICRNKALMGGYWGITMERDINLSIVMPQYPPISALFLHMYVYFLEMRIFCIWCYTKYTYICRNKALMGGYWGITMERDINCEIRYNSGIHGVYISIHVCQNYT
jgi:hypothetical protein